MLKGLTNLKHVHTKFSKRGGWVLIVFKVVNHSSTARTPRPWTEKQAGTGVGQGGIQKAAFKEALTLRVMRALSGCLRASASLNVGPWASLDSLGTQPGSRGRLLKSLGWISLRMKDGCPGQVRQRQPC